MKFLSGIAIVFFLSASASFVFGQRELGVKPAKTGGPLSANQAAYDVQRYDINVRVKPAEQAIDGVVTVTAKIVNPTNVLDLDLENVYTVSDVSLMGAGGNAAKLKFDRPDGKVLAWFPLTKQPGETVAVRVTYSGKPRIAPRPPWVGGFMWEKTADGSPWISIATQNDGADTWLPVKDHPSDKPSSVALHATVPQPLVVAGFGKFQSVIKSADGTQTWSWLMTNPIANYELVFNAAPYKVIRDKYRSIYGDWIPIEFYVLPEDFEKGAWLIEETKKYTAFYEKYIGPYPFRSQKLGIAETPHLGMEHSTLIAYGNKFAKTADGFDSLMLHEYGHEWWANLVTASDWRDFWIHEGFQSFMDTLYLEYLNKGNQDKYFAAMKERMKHTRNVQPIAPREPKIAYEVYLRAPDYIQSDGDIYGKGAVVLHTLRYLIGDAAFFRALRRMAYPTKAMERITDGRQARFVNTDDFLTIAEEESKMNLDWFFELYLRQPKLPKLDVERKNGKLFLKWETPNNMPFPMPIDVEVNGKIQRVAVPAGARPIEVVGTSTAAKIDPKGWVFRAGIE
jgi:aminopeptidase N